MSRPKPIYFRPKLSSIFDNLRLNQHSKLVMICIGYYLFFFFSKCSGHKLNLLCSWWNSRIEMMQPLQLQASVFSCLNCTDNTASTWNSRSDSSFFSSSTSTSHHKLTICWIGSVLRKLTFRFSSPVLDVIIVVLSSKSLVASIWILEQCIVWLQFLFQKNILPPFQYTWFQYTWCKVLFFIADEVNINLRKFNFIKNSVANKFFIIFIYN